MNLLVCPSDQKSQKDESKCGKELSRGMQRREGEFIIIPGGIPHKALMIGEVEETDTWTPPREDWLNGTDDYLKQ